MSKGTKITIFVVLILGACFFAWQFKLNYSRLMDDSAAEPDTDVINVFDARTFDDYIYVEDRPLRTFKFSTYIKAGISGRF